MTLIQIEFTLSNPQFIIPAKPEQPVAICHARLRAQRHGSELNCLYNFHTSHDYNIVTLKTSEHKHNQEHWEKNTTG